MVPDSTELRASTAVKFSDGADCNNFAVAIPLKTTRCILKFPVILVGFALITAAASAQVDSPNPATPQPQEEEALTGKELLEACTAGPAPGSEAEKFCMTFIVGLVQTVSVLQDTGEAEPLFCIDPRVVSPETVRDRAVKWLKGHAQRLMEPAYVLVSEALHQAYPCAPAPNLSGASQSMREAPG